MMIAAGCVVADPGQRHACAAQARAAPAARGFVRAAWPVARRRASRPSLRIPPGGSLLGRPRPAAETFWAVLKKLV